MKDNKENLFLLYLKMKWQLFVLLLVFFLCFSLVFYLSRVPIDPVLYAALLCVYIGLIFFMVDFILFAKRFRTLKRLQKTITVQIDQLPDSKDIIEEKYQNLLEILYENRNELTRQAEAKQRDLVDYFTQWTHQIKTPIAAMRLLLQSEQKEQHAELEMELFKIEQYVEFVLQYLRVENISTDLMFKNHDLDALIKQTIRKHAKLFIGKKITLHYSDVNFSVLTDEKWLLFVLDQILSNALKYTEKGFISVYMNDKQLVMEDSGIGIPEEDVPRVFEKGFTGHNGRTYIQSTGIGLYLCKQILNKLSHGITIESQEGKGTKVIIDLETKALEVE